jgi:predicted AAA+ superfamily ATPase
LLQTDTGSLSAKKETLNDYLRYGSFPFVASLNKNEKLIKSYIEGIYNTILIKDIAVREHITDVSLLDTIARFLSGNVGSPVSAKKISDTLCSNGRKVSVNTVDRYLRALTESYLFYKVDRFDVKGKQQLKTLGKYYIVDIGLRNMLTARTTGDLGHILENIVFLELFRRYSRVFIGKAGENEIDFVTDNGYGEWCYYQVAASVLDENTLKRELEPLQKIRDNHPKFILTLDDVLPDANYDGIRQMHLVDWLTLSPPAT